MAKPISQTPTLTGKMADEFIKQMLKKPTSTRIQQLRRTYSKIFRPPYIKNF
ncbi:MAG: hypothetical protein J4432_00935 [DPANN group archaeon]|nr:hypothetical protein [DPANN group archaeon]